MNKKQAKVNTANPKMKVLGICGEYNAVSWYRMMNPVWRYGGDLTFKVGTDKDGEYDERQVFKSPGLKKAIEEHGDAFFKAYDLVIVKYVATKRDAQSIIAWKKLAPNTKIYMDVDDNVFEIPEGNSAGSKWGEEQQSIYAFLCRIVDGITCSTQPLADYFRMLNKNVYVIPNMVNSERWKFPRVKDNDQVVIGWTYSTTHTPDVPVLGNTFKRLREKYGDKIRIEATGDVVDTIKVVGCPFAMLPQWMREKNWDISIGALADNEFNKGKSNIKWLEATMNESVFVGSRVYPYANSIKHEKTGFLASTEDEWFDILCRLIDSKQLREEVVKNAREVVLKDYEIKKHNPLSILEAGILED